MILDFSFDLPSRVDDSEDFANVRIGSCSAFNLAHFYFSYKKHLNSRGNISRDELRLLNSLEVIYVSCRLKGLV